MAHQLRRSGLRTTETRLRSRPAAIGELSGAANDGGASPPSVG
jgi:hypothetical protein